MAKSKKIRIMLSSRCVDDFPDNSGINLSKIRISLKTEIEEFTLFGNQLFEVWINEDAPPSDGTVDSWEACLQAVRECDVLIVISNGNAGWVKTGGDIGICHAEYMEGLATTRGKVSLIALPNIPLTDNIQSSINKRFQEYVQQQTPFRGGTVNTQEQLRERVFQAINEAVITLTQRGVSAFSSSRFDMGQALDWSRLDFKHRKLAMEKVLLKALSDSGAGILDGAAITSFSGTDIAVIPHAMPAAFTVAAARELVGRPFLLDHQKTKTLKKAHGPLHIIACHRNATESQATSLLGFPDATVVSGPFGIYIADDIQKVQFVFLSNCRDETLTRHALQRFIEWLGQTGEVDNLVKRACSRAKIVKVIATENKNEDI